jgi:hypothetical protein
VVAAVNTASVIPVTAALYTVMVVEVAATVAGALLENLVPVVVVAMAAAMVL